MERARLSNGPRLTIAIALAICRNRNFEYHLYQSMVRRGGRFEGRDCLPTRKRLRAKSQGHTLVDPNPVPRTMDRWEIYHSIYDDYDFIESLI